MDYASFQEREIDRFLSEHYSLDQTREVISLDEQEYPLVRDATKRGIQRGIDDFLGGMEVRGLKVPTAYHARDRFAQDYSTMERVLEEVSGVFRLPLDEITEFALDVCETYRMFVVNESYQRFQEEFQAPALVDRDRVDVRR